MVFGLFTRKPTPDGGVSSEPTAAHHPHARLPTPTPSIASVAHPSPLRFPTALRAVLGGSTESTLRDTDLMANSTGHPSTTPPTVTPSPPPAGPGETKALYDLMLTIPAKTLHAYTLAHLRPQSHPPSVSPALRLQPDTALRPPSPNTVTKLTTFFSTLAPPPLLHCVRCHQDFYNIENEEKDKACRVPHDDESALVSRVSGGTHESLWGCCGQTVSGDGSEGPPDGWCYEGRHTTDSKRARFRADATIHDDKLTSCRKPNCQMRDRPTRRDVNASPTRSVGTSPARKSNPSPARSQASVLIPRSTRKRPRKLLRETSGSESENEADADSATGRAAKAKHRERTRRGAAGGEGDTSTALDEPRLSKSKVKTKSRPISRPQPPASSSTTTSLPAGGHGTSVVTLPGRPIAAKPKSTPRTLLSQSHTHLASDSEASTRSRPRTRSHVREESRARDASRSRPTAKLTRADISERAKRAINQLFSQSEEEAVTDEEEESDHERRGRERKRRRVGRN